MNGTLAVLRANLRRFVNDRSNLFFVVALPLMIVFALGTAIGGGGSGSRVGIYDPAPTPASTAVRERVAHLDGVKIISYSSLGALRDDVARRGLDAGWSVAADHGHTRISWFNGPVGNDVKLRGVVEATVAELGMDSIAIQRIATDSGVTPQVAATQFNAMRTALGASEVKRSTVGMARQDLPEIITATIAGGELTLFIFLTAVAGSQYLLTSRKLGVTRRSLAGPIPVRAIIAGEGLSRLLVCLLQSVIIIGGSTLLFGVNWQAPGLVALLALVMSLVGTGAAMLVGTLFDSEQLVSGVGIFASLVLAALGGSMGPLHFFPKTLRTVAFAITPHAWMNDALWKIQVDRGGFADIWVSVVVLGGLGLALLGIATLVMSRRLR
jgi:ABC-2 type transport system permease protein